MSTERNNIDSKINKELLITGNALYLTKDASLLRKQIEGQQISQVSSEELLSEISTDEIIPNRICLQYTGKEDNMLGAHLLTGLRGNVIKPNDIMNGNFQVLVAGDSFGRGSSRYHAPIALVQAGIKVVIGKTERIFQENAVNAGIFTLMMSDPTAKKLLQNNGVLMSEITKNLSPVQKDVMNAGSLIHYLAQLERGNFSFPQVKNEQRPMTIIEKILANKTHKRNKEVGVDFIQAGEEIIAKPDLYYGYELQTIVVRKALTLEFDEKVQIKDPSKAVLFNDHTALIASDAVTTQQKEQSDFAKLHGIKNYENDEKGSPAICHTKILEAYALPGQLILGNDSHTCTVGALNTLAVGKGAADLAGALAFDKMVIKVPETIRINLTGTLKNGATMKDFMLTLGATKKFKENNIGSGRVLEFGGDALEHLPIDEQLKLTNIAVELQAFTGIIEPNKQILFYIQKMRNINKNDVLKDFVASDSGATYFDTLSFDLSNIEPTVATPGDTQNGVPLSELVKRNITVNKAYIGSCTHGTPEDLKQAAQVLDGKKIHPKVKLYVQASSQDNLAESVQKGYIDTLLKAGAELLLVGCGACMNAGPGSTEEGEVGIFATNRNFPGRTGKGDTYLSSPSVAAASAVAGFICGPDDI